MIKFLLVLLLIPCLAWPYGGMGPGPGFKTYTGGGGSFDDITFFWTVESATMGAGDFSAGDTTATLLSAAAINTDAVKIGTNGLDCPGGSDRAEFDISAGQDIINGTNGRIGFWVNWTTMVDTASVIKISIDGSNYIDFFSFSGLEARWTEGGSNTGVSTGALSTGVWYFIEYAWDAVANTRTVYLDGIQKGQSTAAFNGLAFASETFSIGIYSGAAADLFMDNIMISDDPTRDFCGLSGTCVGLADDTEAPL